jgi:hypothetical protein
LPERLILADPAAYVRDMMGRRDAGLAPSTHGRLPNTSDARRFPVPRTQCARTIVPPPASTLFTTAPIAMRVD